SSATPPPCSANAAGATSNRRRGRSLSSCFRNICDIVQVSKATSASGACPHLKPPLTGSTLENSRTQAHKHTYFSDDGQNLGCGSIAYAASATGRTNGRPRRNNAGQTAKRT